MTGWKSCKHFDKCETIVVGGADRLVFESVGWYIIIIIIIFCDKNRSKKAKVKYSFLMADPTKFK